MNFLPDLALFFALWLIAGTVYRATRRSFMRDPSFVVIGGKALTVAALILWIVPLWYAWSLGKTICRYHGSYSGSYAGAYISYALAFLFAAAAQTALVIRDDLPLARHMQAYDWKLTVVYSSKRILALCGLGTYLLSLHQHSFSATVIGSAPVLLMLLINKFAKSPLRRKLRAPITMDDSPLRAEIVAITQKLGSTPVEIYLQPHQMQGGLADTCIIEDSIMFRAWYQRLRTASPIMPLFILQKMEAPVVTAVMALRFARAFQPFHLFQHLSARLKASKSLTGAGLLTLALAIYALVRYTSGSSMAIAVILTLLVVFTAAAVRFVISLLTQLGGAPIRAYIAWHESGQSEVRSVEEFLTAIALYHRVAYNLFHLETMFIVLKKNKDFQKLILQAELDPEEVWAEVEQRVRAETGELEADAFEKTLPVISESPC